jgi:hypothetical protein
MNSLGISLICSAVQVTLLGLLAAVLYWLALFSAPRPTNQRLASGC